MSDEPVKVQFAGVVLNKLESTEAPIRIHVSGDGTIATCRCGTVFPFDSASETPVLCPSCGTQPFTVTRI
jgi:hypothetical protein